jgi:hypothetical protein
MSRDHSILKVGQRFTRLVIVSQPIVTPNPCEKSPRRNTFSYRCLCDCGNESVVICHKLTHERTRSCGCLRDDVPRDQIRSLSRKHGFLAGGGKRPPEYGVWCGMKRRCYNEADKDYSRYGGRGIRICDRWRDSFAAFYEDIGPRPSPAYQVERDDNNGPYSPDNCRWATAKEQAENKRSNVFLEHDGKRLTIAEWARVTGIGETTIGARLRLGWPAAAALSTPVDKGPPHLIHYDGKSHSLADWSRITGIRYGLLHQRLRLGWPPERAFTAPSRQQQRTR